MSSVRPRLSSGCPPSSPAAEAAVALPAHCVATRMEHSLPKSTIFKTAVALALAAAAADDDGFAFSAKLLLGGARAAIKYVVLAAAALCPRRRQRHCIGALHKVVIRLGRMAIGSWDSIVTETCACV